MGSISEFLLTIYWFGLTGIGRSSLTINYTLSIVTAMDGNELLQIRRSLGLTQEQMADLIGVRANTIARWERDELRISEPVSRLIRLLAKTMPVQKQKNKRRG
jgi:DNA-binding transcriptional regulator YiaG